MKRLDPALLLATEARIVAEDDTHVAIVFRVRKSRIARNLAFLTALSDVIGTVHHLARH